MAKIEWGMDEPGFCQVCKYAALRKGHQYNHDRRIDYKDNAKWLIMHHIFFSRVLILDATISSTFAFHMFCQVKRTHVSAQQEHSTF